MLGTSANVGICMRSEFSCAEVACSERNSWCGVELGLVSSPTRWLAGMSVSPKQVSLGMFGALHPRVQGRLLFSTDEHFTTTLPVIVRAASVDCCWHCCKACFHGNVSPSRCLPAPSLVKRSAQRGRISSITVWTQPPSCPATYKLLEPNRTAPNGDPKPVCGIVYGVSQLLENAPGCRCGHRATARIQLCMRWQFADPLHARQPTLLSCSWKTARTSNLRPNDWLERRSDMRDVAARAHCEEVGQCSRAARR
ncbi:hypothetical protein P171DRAFT_87185 [Karstenula rhodostoma CBS 690.94]|uniref:Uncharacterized protein n=1 Tax=Karstenula rhodostoma CBS 690.94 TaxID=1392251 RepID=A0A9P4PDL3_9PLEO|nr:hypothetical protein P171DRAFT_87185 [Karstenula rhodostoma CBS 690.94]